MQQPPRAAFNNGAYIERRTIQRDGGLAGQTVAIQGLSATSTDVLARIENLDGSVQTERLTPTRTSFVVQARPGAIDVAANYLRLGVEHILFGFDHLLFVLALVILVRDWRRVALTVTAFTVAHSITLAAATLGFVTVPGPPIEAAIALSIVLVAVEIVNARRGRPSAGGALAVARRLLLRTSARFRLCWRPGRSRIATPCHSNRAAVFQSWRGDRAAGFCGGGSAAGEIFQPCDRIPPRACAGRSYGRLARGKRCLHNRRGSSVLADREDRCFSCLTFF